MLVNSFFIFQHFLKNGSAFGIKRFLYGFIFFHVYQIYKKEPAYSESFWKILACSPPTFLSLYGHALWMHREDNRPNVSGMVSHFAIHSISFLFVQLKDKIFWKPADVSFYLFPECYEILNYNIKKLEVNLCCEGAEFSLNIYSFSSFLLKPTLLRGVCGGFSNFFRYSNMRAMSSS